MQEDKFGYGKIRYKGSHRKRPEEDGNVRYSRYVLIVQPPTEENDQTVLCIPFSSKSTGIHEFEVVVQFNLVDKDSYGRIDKLFPANRKHLAKYICAMDDDSMEQVNQKLLYILGLVEHKTINTGVRQVEKEKKKEKEDRGVSKPNAPVSKNNVVSSNLSEVVFSGNKGEDMDKRILLAAQGKENVIQNPSRSNRNWKEDVIRIPPKRTNRKWDDESRKEFCIVCADKGVDTAAKIYGLKIKTVENYCKEWMKLYDISSIMLLK